MIILVLFLLPLISSCPVNTYGPMCLPCLVNTYSNGTVCTPCPLQYERPVNKLTCRKRQTFCPKPRLGSPINCTECPTSTYTSSVCTAAQNNKCTNCTICKGSEYEIRPCSKFQDRICDNCSNNIPGNSSWTKSCQWRCNPGYYNVSDECVLCDAGSQCDGLQSQLCNIGKYSTSMGASTCLTCPSATFNNLQGTTTCVSCGIGSYSTNSICLSCAAGTFQSIVGATTCTNCSANTFCPQNSVAPSQCPGNSVSKPKSASFKDCQCPLGQYGVIYNEISSTCLPCPIGYYCRASTCPNSI